MLIHNMASIISLFKEKQLKPAWQFNAGALIWRILFTSNNLIIGETRNQVAKSTSFFCINAHSGKPVWGKIEFGEPWWIGIEAIYDRWLILHGFTRPDMPEHKGIRIVELSSGKLLWKNAELSYWFVSDQKLYAYKYII